MVPENSHFFASLKAWETSRPQHLSPQGRASDAPAKPANLKKSRRLNIALTFSCGSKMWAWGS